jgi:hypothetical protein
LDGYLIDGPRCIEEARSMRFSRSFVLAAAAATCLLSAAPAGASYQGVIESTDHTMPGRLQDEGGPTTCDAVPFITGNARGPFRYDEFAFRNDGTANTCATLTGQNVSCSSATVDISLAPVGGLFGSDAPSCSNPQHAHTFLLTGHQAFVELVTSSTIGSTYDLAFAGTDVVPVQLAAAKNVPLGGGNILSVNTSSHEDGTGVFGSLTVTAGPGHRYSGPVRCLRVSGQNASLVMTFDGTQQGLASKWKGAVYWLHQSLDGQSNAERNSILDQGQLDRKFATCPDPNAPLSPGFHTITGATDLQVVSNGPQATG